jgi:hypothetical protein
MTWRQRGGLVLAFFAFVALVSFTANASGAEEPLYSSQKSFGPDGTEGSDFATFGAPAIDQGSALVYKIDTEEGKLFKFDLNGQPVDFEGSSSAISENTITGLSFNPRIGGSQVAVDSALHTVYVTSGGAVVAFDQEGEPIEFTAGPGVNSNEIGGFGELLGVAVDSHGYIYASDGGGGNGGISIYAPTGEFVTQLDLTFRPGNIAVAADGTILINEFGFGVKAFDPSAPLPVTNATTYTERASPISTDFTRSVFVDPASGRIFLAQSEPGDFTYGRVAVYDSDGSFLGTVGAHGESGEVGNLVAGVGVYGATGRLFVSSGSKEAAGTDPFSKVQIYEPPEEIVGPPTIFSTSATAVSASFAVLRAEINPNTGNTVYHFEFGPGDCSVTECNAVPVTPKDIGGGHEVVKVSQAIAGLQSRTTYHYRVIASNELGPPTISPDHTFMTQPASTGFRPADSRVWEMVSPVEKYGATIVSGKTAVIQAAADGNGLAYVSVGSLEPFPEGNRALEGSRVLATRHDEGVWGSKDLTPPHSEIAPSRPDNEYKLFSPNLGEALLEPRDQTPLSVEASERTPYLRQNDDPIAFTPLVTSKAPFANVPAGVHFGEVLGGAPYPLRVVGTSRDLKHIVLSSRPVLVEEEAQERALYLWEDRELKAVSRTPSNEGADIIEGVLGSAAGSIHNAISADGSRVFWASISSGSGYSETNGVALTALYGFDRVSGETFRLDVPEDGVSGSGARLPVFQAADSNGSIVFFTDTQQLTAGASAHARDLYRCVVGESEGQLGCVTLSDLSAPRAGSGEDAEVMNIAPAASEDGKRIYFLAKGVLSTEPGAGGALPSTGQPNLYLWEAGSGVRFIATLSPRDYLDWGAFTEEGKNAGEGARVVAAGSPSGEYFTFMSQKSLTGSDNLDVDSREPLEEAYLFDADADANVLTCISCDPTGAGAEGQHRPPHLEGQSGSPADLGGLWADRWVGATLAVPSESELFSLTFYRPRSVLDNGRVFFNAFDGLVSADSNGTWDVYQFETVGVGSCTAGAGDSTVARVGDGCVALISSGTAGGDSAFMDASVTGDDAFFLTRGALSAIDRDDAVDVYDARVNGIRAEVRPVPECAGENCQAPTAAPNDPTPASEAFHGKAGPVHCVKRKRKAHRRAKARCAGKHRHRKHHRHHHRQGGKR